MSIPSAPIAVQTLFATFFPGQKNESVLGSFQHELKKTVCSDGNYTTRLFTAQETDAILGSESGQYPERKRKCVHQYLRFGPKVNIRSFHSAATIPSGTFPGHAHMRWIMWYL